MTENLQLRPGQKLNLIGKGTTTDSLGRVTETDVTTVLSYEEILAAFKQQTSGKGLRNFTEASAFSRSCTLSKTVIETGKWRTGTPADRVKVVDKVVDSFTKLDPIFHSQVKNNAMKALDEMSQSKHLKPEQRTKIKDVLDKIKAAGAKPAA